MNHKSAIARLHAQQTKLKKLGVEHSYMFGATTPGEARDDADVDLFFDCWPRKSSLFDLVDVQERASAILGCKADAMTRDSLHKALKQWIEANATRIF